MCVSTFSVLYVLEETGQLITELVAGSATFLQLILGSIHFLLAPLARQQHKGRGAGKCHGLAAQPKKVCRDVELGS